MGKTLKKRGNKLLPIQIILDAKKGDVLAMNEVIKHFEGYMTTLATREMTDEFGNTYSYIDYDIYHRLEIKLITAIITKFNVDGRD